MSVVQRMRGCIRSQHDWALTAIVSSVLLSMLASSPVAFGQAGSEQDRKKVLAQSALMIAEKMYESGQVDRAIVQWREALGYDPSLVQAHSQLGLVLRDKANLRSLLPTCAK